MSHYTVLVVGHPDDIPALLAPYDENTKVEPYHDEDGDETTYNPRSKWDWWALGGRWTGFFKAVGDDTLLGRPGAFDGPAEPGTCDAGRRADVELVHRPYAVVTAEGWREKASMGWFGMDDSTDEKTADFEQWFDQFWASIPADQWVSLVDCHI